MTVLQGCILTRAQNDVATQNKSIVDHQQHKSTFCVYLICTHPWYLWMIFALRFFNYLVRTQILGYLVRTHSYYLQTALNLRIFGYLVCMHCLSIRNILRLYVFSIKDCAVTQCSIFLFLIILTPIEPLYAWYLKCFDIVWLFC